jgi:hypothetical protein
MVNDRLKVSGMPNPNAFPMKVLRAPRGFALAAMLLYVLATLPVLALHRFDASIFIAAGDRYVDQSKLAAPIIVQPHSDGYDGQFYYRVALAPFDFTNPAYGVRFDNPAWRTQRIVYPLLAWAAAFGRADLVPLSLFVMNLLGIGAIALFAARLTALLKLPVLTPLAIILWPGFIVSLAHDTTEIIACAFLLGALDAYLRGRIAAYAALAALTTLTRETGIVLFFGVFCFEIIAAVRAAEWRRLWPRVVLAGLALVPFPVWRELQFVFWAQSPLTDAARDNMSWPLAGFFHAVAGTISGASFGGGGHVALRIYALAAMALVAIFCGLVLLRLRAAFRTPGMAPLAAGWLPLFALMMLLTSPWVQTAFLRAFSECFVVGCLIVASRPPRLWAGLALVAGCALAAAASWAGFIGTLRV